MKLTLIIISVVIATVATSVPSTNQEPEMMRAWVDFKKEHNKRYREKHEEDYRIEVFKDNYLRIQKHNRRFAKGLEKFKLKFNKFSDLPTKEFARIYTGFKPLDKPLDNIETIRFVPDPTAKIPSQIDWRVRGAVTEVKDQGACGSCWTFSTTGTLEGQHFLKTGTLKSLSEQNLLDCTEGAGGCDGGDMYLAYSYIHNNDGIESEVSYPYEAAERSCRYDVRYNVTSLKGYASIEHGNEEDLKAAVATIGPISVGIDASDFSFQFFGSGLFERDSCGNKESDLNHAVLAVGYGTDENGDDYWLIKNSWAASWGDHGYVKMARNKGNKCGIATHASFPLTY